MYFTTLLAPFLLAATMVHGSPQGKGPGGHGPPGHGGPGKGGAAIKAELLAAKGGSVESFLKIWDSLPAASAKAIIGTYKGTDLTPQLSGEDKIGWYGKRFVNETWVDPLLGTKVNEDGSKTIYTYPRKNIAQLREIKFRGKTVASIIYDSTPILDYFVQVDKDTFLGVGDQKGLPLAPIFLLERAPADLKVLET